MQVGYHSQDGSHLQDMSGEEMSRYDVRPCPCGSGQSSQWQFDAKGIPLTRTCHKCHEMQMRRYRPEILTGYSQADLDEQIEEDV